MCLTKSRKCVTDDETVIFLPPDITPTHYPERKCILVKSSQFQGSLITMKHQNKKTRRYYGKETSKSTISTMEVTNNCRKGGKINKKQKTQFHPKHRKFHTNIVRDGNPLQYLFYAILNTDLRMDLGTAIATIADGLISLYSKLDSDQIKCQYIDNWITHGKKIIILKGYDHKHLKYLKEELKFVAVDTFAVREAWGRNRAILMLAVFGVREDLDEILGQLSHLR